jgi:hypothetical protein
MSPKEGTCVEIQKANFKLIQKLYFRKLKKKSFDDFGVLIEKFISSLSWLVQLPSIESPIFMWKR